jgi:hypothetical protein
MPFQYTFRADDITTWEAETRDLIENRDRELELYSTTIDTSFLNLNASNLTSGTVPSARMTGAYTGITELGTLTGLAVSGTATVTASSGTAMRVTNTGVGASFLVEDSASTDSTPFIIDSAGRVGIGNTSPSQLLDVWGVVRVSSSSINDAIQIQPSGSGVSSRSVTLFPSSLTANRTLTLPDATGTVITTGNLSSITAVGTLASGSIPASLLTGTIASARISGSYTGITGVGTLAAGSIPATLLTGTVASARIAGAYTGFTSITVDGANSPAMVLGDWPSGAGFASIETNRGYLLLGATSGDNSVYLRSVSASVRLGTPSVNTVDIDGTRLLLQGNISLALNNTYQCAALPAFGFNAWAGVSSYNFYNASDIRYKANVEELPLGLDFIKLLNPIEFTYVYPEFGEDSNTPTSTTEGSRLRAGLSAQNVKEALETVNAGDYNFWALANKNDPESFQALDYTGLVAPIIKAIQELDARLQQLETV